MNNNTTQQNRRDRKNGIVLFRDSGWNEIKPGNNNNSPLEKETKNQTIFYA